MTRRVDVKDKDGKILYSYTIHSKNKEQMNKYCQELNSISDSGYYSHASHAVDMISEFEIAKELYLKTIGIIDD